MKKRILLSILTIFCATATLFAQNEDKSADANKENQAIDGFVMKQKFPAGVENSYSFTDSTSVERINSDKSKRIYTRVCTYYFTAKAPVGPNNGFQEVNYLIDSMDYCFKEGKETFEYHSQIDSAPHQDFKDLTLRMVPMSREFTVTYSPYGEVAEIKGESIDWLKDYLAKNKDALHGEDTIIVNIWNRGISESFLKNFADMNKNFIPDKRVYKDSTYKRPIALELDGLPFHGNMDVKFTENFANTFTLKGEGKDFSIGTDESFLYGISGMSYPLEGSANGSIEMKVSARGTVREVNAEFSAKAKLYFDTKTFDQTIHTFLTWKLLAQTK